MLSKSAFRVLPQLIQKPKILKVWENIIRVESDTEDCLRIEQICSVLEPTVHKQLMTEWDGNKINYWSFFSRLRNLKRRCLDSRHPFVWFADMQWVMSPYVLKTTIFVLTFAMIWWTHSACHSLQQQGLKKRLREIIPIKQAEVKDVRTRLGSKVLGTCTVEQAYSGMRDVKVMVYETSLLDSQEVNNKLIFSLSPTLTLILTHILHFPLLLSLYSMLWLNLWFIGNSLSWLYNSRTSTKASQISRWWCRTHSRRNSLALTHWWDPNWRSGFFLPLLIFFCTLSCIDFVIVFHWFVIVFCILECSCSGSCIDSRTSQTCQCSKTRRGYDQ